jgi:hypothetical protein
VRSRRCTGLEKAIAHELVPADHAVAIFVLEVEAFCQITVRRFAADPRRILPAARRCSVERRPPFLRFVERRPDEGMDFGRATLRSSGGAPLCTTGTGTIGNPSNKRRRAGVERKLPVFRSKTSNSRK